jgi:anti-anti-sigma factor
MMIFNVTSEITDNGIAKITLSGELDASVSSVFNAEVESAFTQGARRLVLLVKDLEYMSSAGLRVLVFAKQKLGSNVDIYIVGAQEAVMEPITMTGLHHSVFLLNEYDPAAIEAL